MQGDTDPEVDDLSFDEEPIVQKLGTPKIA